MNCHHQFVKVRATTRFIHQGVSQRKMSLSPQKGNHLPIPQLRKRRRTRKMRKGSRIRKMMRKEKTNIMREIRKTRERGLMREISLR